MKLYAVKTRLIRPGDDLVKSVLDSLKTQNLSLEDNDILALTSKIVSYSEKRIVRISDVEASEKAKKLAKQFSLKPEFAELILREADKICGGVEKAVLTLKQNMMTANAGIDNKNTPPDHAILWPKDPSKSAKQIRDKIRKKTGKRVGVLIVDSGLVPLRIGTIGLALAVAGFKPIKDIRGKKDLFGKPIAITRQAVADDLASATHLLMGEATEKTPFVLIKNAPAIFDESAYGSVDLMMPARQCIFMNTSATRIEGRERKART